MVLISYDINTSKPEQAFQRFKNSYKLKSESEANNLKSKKTTFNWVPYKAPIILFVQIQPAAFKDEFKALDIRDEVETKINEALNVKDQGQSVAGDIGFEGANILFEVNNDNNSLQIILDILQKSGLEKYTIIGRRVNTAANDWFYEVIYPYNFNGIFQTM